MREAVSELKSEGLVNAQQGRGVFVCERGSRRAFTLATTALDDRGGIAYIIELLVALESAAARLAAVRHTVPDTNTTPSTRPSKPTTARPPPRPPKPTCATRPGG